MIPFEMRNNDFMSCISMICVCVVHGGMNKMSNKRNKIDLKRYREWRNGYMCTSKSKGTNKYLITFESNMDGSVVKGLKTVFFWIRLHGKIFEVQFEKLRQALHKSPIANCMRDSVKLRAHPDYIIFNELEILLAHQ